MACDSWSVVIDMDKTDDPLAIANAIQHKIDAIEEKEKTPIKERPFCIFRVPEHIRKNNENCYEPRMVSIGPYHRNKKHLKAMDEHKWRYLRDFIKRFPDPKENRENIFQTCVMEMKSLEPSAREYYFESVGKELGPGHFTEMMLLDGCFILELLMKWTYEPDVMCNVGWSIPLITSDLLMLDNQIPFIVLQKLYRLLVGNDDVDETPARSPGARSRKPSLVDLVLPMLMREKKKVSQPDSSVELYHLLHLYYLCFIPKISQEKSSNKCLLCLRQMISPTWIFSLILFTYRKLRCTICHHQSSDDDSKSDPPMITDDDSKSDPPEMIPCATDLQEAGVKFEKAPGSFRNITFSQADGVLKIPYLAIEGSTTTRFMNLIAFEQSSVKEKVLTSYAVFMDCLVNTPKDIAILQQKGIIENKLASEEEASRFFNQLRDCSYIDYANHELAGVFKGVRKYCELDWPKYRARMCRDYFNSPWSIFSLAAALILLFLTAAQTYFTVFPH